MDSSQSLHRRPAKWPIWLVLLGALGAAGVYGVRFWKKEERRRYLVRFGPIPMPDRIARVPSQWSVDKLADRLQKTGKVHESAAFEQEAAKIGLQSVEAGAYELPESAAPRDLARIFKAGPTLFKVTFPEGFTGWQMAARLQKLGFQNAASFEALVYPPGKESPYEGTLFPKTYNLPYDAPPKTLVARLQKQFDATLETLPRPFPKVGGHPLSTRELVTLASLIEREAASADEMPTVAGVLLNRLNAPMRLQVDAALEYARLQSGQGHKKRIFNADLKVKSPYNTYLNDGLPPGPICNPGEAALQAAAKPAPTDALYYVYSPKLKHHRFARTLNEHVQNKNLAARERRG